MTHLICISDLHINSTLAICPPTVNLDDGGTYHASRLQRAIYDAFQDFTKQAAALTGRKILIINGDLGELDTKKRSIQLVTLNKATIQAMALDVILPLVSICASVLVVRGTEAHTGKSAWLEEAIAADLDTHIPDKRSSTASWWQWRGRIDGVRLDIAHHASAGGAPWTRGLAAHRMAAKATWDYMVGMQAPPPDILLRAHNHTSGDSHDAYPVRAVMLPCWIGTPSYGYRAGFENRLPDIGGAIITCEAGKAQVEHVVYKPREQDVKRLWANAL